MSALDEKSEKEKAEDRQLNSLADEQNLSVQEKKRREMKKDDHGIAGSIAQGAMTPFAYVWKKASKK